MNPILAVGSVAFDSIKTPFGEANRVVGGAATYFAIAASFFTDVRIPDAQRLGPAGEGWRVAITTLMNERVALERLAIEDQGEGMIRHAVRLWKERGTGDPVMRDRLMGTWIEAEVQRARQAADAGA